MAPPTKTRPLPGQPTRSMPATPTTPPTKISPLTPDPELSVDPFAPLAHPFPFLGSSSNPSKTVVGGATDFGQFMVHFRFLENHIDRGWSHKDRISAYRKIWYDDKNWDQVIKGAAGVKQPPQWASTAKSSLEYLKDHQEIRVSGKKVDVGHLFTGSDASQHPEASLEFTRLQVTLVLLRKVSNAEFATFIGDLGSVVSEYMDANNDDLIDKKTFPTEADLRVFYDGPQAKISPADMAGDADGIVFPWDSAKSLSENMETYYSELLTGKRKRFTSFALAIGLGKIRADNSFENEDALRPKLQEKIRAAAESLLLKTIHLRILQGQLRDDILKAASGMVRTMFLKTVRDEVIKEK